MGKRIIRLMVGELAEKTPLLLGQEAHVVLRNGATFRGRIATIEAEVLTLNDINSRWYNAKRHAHCVAFTEIAEVQLEHSAAW